MTCSLQSSTKDSTAKVGIKHQSSNRSVNQRQ